MALFDEVNVGTTRPSCRVPDLEHVTSDLVDLAAAISKYMVHARPEC